MSASGKIDRYIEEHLQGSVEEMTLLCTQPSISAQNSGIVETAELVVNILSKHGLGAEILATDGHPVVYAEASGNSDRTLIFYNHYDVQPPEPLDLWESPPFEPQVRDGKLYARGVADDKGDIISRLAALDALRDASGNFPCNIKFLIEGEEEIGSVNLPSFISAHKDLLAADACIWESGGSNHEGRPVLYLGMRGICYVELSVRTAVQDAHSGLGGSIFPNAAWRLAWALSTLKGVDEHILIPGFHDDVREPTERDMELLAKLPSEEEELKRIYGVEDFLNGLTGLDLKREAVFSPTCTICGLTSGYQGSGPKTVLPAEAKAKVDFRLVPDQDPDDIVAKLRQYLDRNGFSDVEINQLTGEHPARVDPDDPFVKLALETAEEVYGIEGRIAPIIGGSGPMYPFVHDLGLPIATPGIGYMESGVHAPNEHIRLEDFVKGTKHTARILDRFALG